MMPSNKHDESFRITKQILYEFTKRPLIQYTLTLVGGNAGAQLLNLSTIPVITRLYSPEQMGIFAVFSALVMMISAVAALRFDMATVIPKHEEDAMNLFFLGIVSLVTVVMFFLGIVFIFGDTIAAMVPGLDLKSWLWFLPAGVALICFQRIFRFYRIRTKGFKVIAFERIYTVVAAQFFKIAVAVFIGSFVWGLIAGLLIGALCGLAVLLVHPPSFQFKKSFKQLSIGKMRKLMGAYRQFPLFSMPNILMINASQHVVVFLFSFFFTPAVVGYYNIASRVVQQPLNLISMSLQNALLQNVSEKANKKQALAPIYIKSTKSLFYIGIFPLIVFLWIGPELFSLVFGSQWETAGHYAVILSPLFFMMLVNSPSNVIFEITKKQATRFYINLVSLVVSVVAIFIGYYFFKTVQSSLFIFSTANCLVRIFLLTFALKIVYSIDKNIILPDLGIVS